jgi:hypothetical protein
MLEKKHLREGHCVSTIQGETKFHLYALSKLNDIPLARGTMPSWYPFRRCFSKGFLQSKTKKYFYGLAAGVFLFALMVHSIPALTTEYPMGIDTYYFLRIGGLMHDSGFHLSYDPLSFGGRPFQYPAGLPLLMGLLASFSDLAVSGIAVSVVAGALCSVVLFFISGELFKGSKRSVEISAFAAILFALVPVVLWRTSGAVINMTYEVLLFFTVLYFLFNGRLRRYFIVPFLGLILFSPALAVVAALISLAYIKKSDKWLKFCIIASLAISIINTAFFAGSFSSIYVSRNLPPEIYRAIYPPVDLQGIFYRLNPLIFALGLLSGALALKHAKARTERNKLVFFLLSSALLVALLAGFAELDRMSFYLSGPLCIGTAYLLSRIPARKLMFAAFAVLLVPAAVLAGMTAADMSYVTPTQAEMAVLKASNSAANETILSTEVNGHVVSYATGSKNFLDGNLINAPNLSERYEAARAIYTTFDSTLRQDLLEKNSINYIFLSRWEREKFQADEKYFHEDSHLMIVTRENQTFLYRVTP